MPRPGINELIRRVEAIRPSAPDDLLNGPHRVRLARLRLSHHRAEEVGMKPEDDLQPNFDEQHAHLHEWPDEDEDD